jgi:hypothetical protein
MIQKIDLPLQIVSVKKILCNIQFRVNVQVKIKLLEKKNVFFSKKKKKK